MIYSFTTIQRESADSRSKALGTMPPAYSGLSSMGSEGNTHRRGGSPSTPSRSRFHQADADRLTSGGSSESVHRLYVTITCVNVWLNYTIHAFN